MIRTTQGKIDRSFSKADMIGFTGKDKLRFKRLKSKNGRNMMIPKMVMVNYLKNLFDIDKCHVALSSKFYMIIGHFHRIQRRG